MMRYKHTQIGHTIIWVALGAAVFVATMGTFAQGGPGTSLIVEVILLVLIYIYISIFSLPCLGNCASFASQWQEKL